jgi:putative CocE/NonD family hydrolase
MLRIVTEAAQSVPQHGEVEIERTATDHDGQAVEVAMDGSATPHRSTRLRTSRRQGSVRWRTALCDVVAMCLLGCAGKKESRVGTALMPVSPTEPAPPAGAMPAFELTRAMVPMRDGVSLETVIIAPRGASKTLPVLLTRTPYGVPTDERRVLGEWFEPLRADGYIYVWQSIRGRFGSEGVFVPERPPRRDRSDPQAVDETTDAYDAIDWLVEHVPNNNGRVGMIGGSYSAWTATMALLEPHPALKVISEAASPADQFLGDDLHHNGAFRLSYAFEFAAFLESSKEQNTRFDFDRRDTYEWFLSLGPLSRADELHFHGKFASWNDLVNHPNRDEFWLRRSLTEHLKEPAVPTLNVAGSWDQEDYYGPLAIYTALERGDTRGVNHLVLGPWNHDGWSGPGRKLGDVDFDSDTGVYYRKELQAVWLACWLHDKPVAPLPEARVFVSGKNVWQSFDRWPPTDHVVKTRLYLRERHKLAFEPPSESGPGAFDEYVSDPDNPVPYVRRPIQPIHSTSGESDWPIWEALDQRFVDHRPDAPSWETDVLDRDVVVLGDVTAELFASTSGSDSDWVVKLIDVYPDGTRVALPDAAHRDGPPASESPALDMRGYQLMIAGEVFRGRFRTSFEKPERLTPGKVLRYEIPLRARAHAFLKGHKIRVQIQSTWFPLIDRNPQSFMPSIFAAKASDFVKATQRIGRARDAATAIVLPVLSP